jgi:hypothetical protein
LFQKGLSESKTERKGPSKTVTRTCTSLSHRQSSQCTEINLGFSGTPQNNFENLVEGKKEFAKKKRMDR